MRIYIPGRTSDFAEMTFGADIVHLVSDALRAELHEDDDEYLEMVATLAAADDSLRAATADSPLRVVIAADVPESALDLPAGDNLPTARVLTAPVTWDDVAAILMDDDSAADLNSRAISGDEAAFEASEDNDLLWFDPTEREVLAHRFA